MGLEDTALGETITFSPEELGRSSPFEDVKLGETVEFNETDLQRMEDVQTPQETQSNYMEETDRVIDAPTGMVEPEINFLDKVQNDEDAETPQFFGYSRLFEKTADVVALPFKGAAATLISGGSGGEAGARLKLADAISQGLNEDVAGLRAKVKAGGTLTDAEKRVLRRDTSEITHPLFNFLFRKPEDIKREQVKRAVRKGDTQKIEEFRAEEQKLRGSVAKIRTNADELISKHFARPPAEDTTLAETVLYDFGGVGTSIAVSIGLAVVTKNPVASATLFAELQSSEVYLEARDAGIDIDKASSTAKLAGIVEGGLEFIGVNYFFKIAENSKGLTKHLFRMAEEAMQEFSQTISEEAITQTTGIREVDIPGALKNAGYSAFLGALGGGATSVGLDALSKDIVEETKGAVTKEQAKAYLEKVRESSGTMEEIIASEIESEASMSKTQEDGAATQEALAYMEQFATGKPIDVTKLDRETYETLQEMRDTNIEAGLDKLSAQEGTNFVAVPARPETLSEFLKKAGGLKADTAEAQRFTRKENPNLKGVANKNGTLSLDEARELAVEAGFLRDVEDVEAITDVQTLLDALEQEAVGVDIVRDADQGALLNRDQIIEFNEQRDEANQELRENKRAITTFRQAFKEGVKLARKDVKAAQETAISLIEQAVPDLNDRAKFITTIKNIQTADQLRAAAPQIQRRIERLMSAKIVRKQKSRIGRLLSKKSIKAKKQGGKAVGKFDAATQVRLEELQDLHQKSGRVEKEGEFEGTSEAGRLLEKRLADEDIDDPLGNAVLQIKAAPNDVSPEQLAVVAESIDALRNLGVEEANKRFNTRRQEAKDIRDEIENHIDPDRKLLTKKQSAKGVRKSFREGVAWAVESWNDYIDRIAPADIVEKMEIGKEISEGKRIHRVMHEKFTNTAQEIYGGSVKDLNKVLDESNVPEDLGVFTNMRGEEERIEITKAQARKLWMEYQNVELREKTLQSENGNAYTDTMMRAMFDVLDPTDIQFAEAQLDIYEEFYDQINEVYSRVFGINLPKSDFYSPIARDADLKEENVDPFLREASFRRSLASGSALKLRDKKAAAALSRQSDLAVFNKHIAEMSHFIAFREKTTLLNDVFSKADLRRKLDAKFGKQYLKNVDQIVERIAGGGKQAANIADRTINYFNRNFATSVLGGKAKIGMSQLSSYFAYGEFIPSAALVDGTRDFVMNPAKAIKVLSQSELLRDRGYSPEVDIQRMGETFDSKFLRKVQKKKENLIDYTLIFTKLGDRGAIYLGGWPVYKHAIEQGKTHEEALALFERATAKTQQSKDVDQMSLMQMEKSIGRTLSMFQSAPFAQFRGEVRAFRQYFFKNEITGKEFGKRFAIYHILIPQFYRALSNGLLFGEFDEEDQMWALMTGSLNAIPLFSDLINFGIRTARGKPTHQGGLLKWAPNIYGAVGDGLDAIMLAGEGDFELATEYLADTAMNIGSIVGLPTPQAEQIMDGMEDIEFGETKSGVMKILGFPDSVAEGDD